MDYLETCDYLYNQIPMFEKQGASGYKEGLANTLALDEHFGHPHQRMLLFMWQAPTAKAACRTP